MMKIGWLSPDGDFFECRYQGHLILADELCGNYYPGTYCGYERKLEESGWVKIGLSLFGNKEYFIHFETGLSEYQKNFLKNWCEEHTESGDKIPLNSINESIVKHYLYED